MAADDPSATAAAKTVPDHAKQLAALDLPKDKWNGHGQDRGELVLLQWLTECEKAVNTLPQVSPSSCVSGPHRVGSRAGQIGVPRGAIQVGFEVDECDIRSELA